jgi:carboxylesterase
MADALHRAGYAVRAPLLAGHTDLESLESSTWRDWYAGALEAFEDVRDGGRRHVIVLGFSMGALLALRLSALRGTEIDAAVSISVPLHVSRWKKRAITTLARLREAPMLRDFIGVFSKSTGPDIRVQRQVEDSPSLGGFPYPTLAELVALQEDVEDLLPHVRVPLLLIHGALDHTASPADSERVAQLVASERVERVVLPRSFHVIGLDLDRDHACTEIVGFANSIFKPSSDKVAP